MPVYLLNPNISYLVLTTPKGLVTNPDITLAPPEATKLLTSLFYILTTLLFLAHYKHEKYTLEANPVLTIPA